MKRRVSRSELPKYIRIMILDFWKVLTVWSFGANKKITFNYFIQTGLHKRSQIQRQISVKQQLRPTLTLAAKEKSLISFLSIKLLLDFPRPLGDHCEAGEI